MRICREYYLQDLAARALFVITSVLRDLQRGQRGERCDIVRLEMVSERGASIVAEFEVGLESRVQ